VEAVLWIARTGSPWRDLPPQFGNWNSVYQRFARWSRAGVWHRVFAALAKERRFREVFIDSTIVRAHQHAAGAPKNGPQALGRSPRRLTTKIHVLVDALGHLVQGRLTAGPVHDVTQATALLRGVPAKHVVGDKAYDADSSERRSRRWGAGRHPATRQSSHVDPMEQAALSSSQPRRTLFLSPQTLSAHSPHASDKLAERFASFVCLVGAVVCSR